MLQHPNPDIRSSPTLSPQMPHRNISHAYVSSNNKTADTPATVPSRAPATDIIGTVLGDFGIWQLRTVLIIFLCKLPASWFMACIIFTAPELYPRTEYECDASQLNANQTVTPDQCYLLDSSTGTEEQERCTHFLYNYDFPSVVTQFDLVCIWGSVYLAWTQYWHLFGVLVGGVVGTKMMLRVSPRNVYIVGMVAQIFCGVITGYARDFSLHSAFRCFSAICCAMMFTAGQAIFVDITAGAYRLGAIILYDTFWSIGVILLPGLSAFFNHWSHIYLGITFPTVVLMVLLQWTPESPRWLLKNGREQDVDRVEQLVRDAAVVNDRTFKIPPDFRQQLEALRQSLNAQAAPASWMELWQGPRAKTHMIAAHLALAAFVINFMGMLLNIRSFGRDYLVPNTIAMGFSEIVGCFLALHFTLKFNKWKWQWAGGFNIIAGLIGCLGWTFSHADSMNATLKVVLWMIIATIPKAGVSCAQSMILACMNELVPANKKMPFVFSVVTWARVWLLSAPFFNVLKVYDVALSLCAYSVLSIIGGFCTCLLLTPRSSTAIVAPHSTSADKKEQSPLTAAVWTVEDDVHNTRL